MFLFFFDCAHLFKAVHSIPIDPAKHQSTPVRYGIPTGHAFGRKQIKDKRSESLLYSQSAFIGEITLSPEAIWFTLFHQETG